MECKAHAMSDSDDSDGQYVPLYARLQASKGSTGSSFADPISVGSSSEDESEASNRQPSSCTSKEACQPAFSLHHTSPVQLGVSPPHSQLSPPPLQHTPLHSQHSLQQHQLSPSHLQHYSPPPQHPLPHSQQSSASSQPAPTHLLRSPPPSPPRRPRPAPAAAGRVPQPTAEAKRQRQLQRQEAKRQKELEKRLRQAEAAAKRSVRPEHCQKSLHVLVDPHLLELEGGGQVLAALQATDVVVHVTARPQPGTITWERDVASWHEADGEVISRTTREPEDQIVAVYAAESLASLIEEQTADPSRGLTGAMRDLGRSSGKTVTLLSWGLDKLCRTKTMVGSYKKGEAVRNGGGKRRKGAPKLDRLQMEAVLVDTLLDTPHNFRFVNSPTEGGEFLAQMSKAIAEAPFKRRRAEPQFSWFAEADSARPVKVDREQRGLRRLWAEQLRQLPGGSIEAAQAVADVYPSPQALIKAYAACLSEQERQALVADLPIRRTVGPLVSSRRVGKEMSRKLYLVMSSIDGATEI